MHFNLTYSIFPYRILNVKILKVLIMIFKEKEKNNFLENVNLSDINKLN